MKSFAIRYAPKSIDFWLAHDENWENGEMIFKYSSRCIYDHPKAFYGLETSIALCYQDENQKSEVTHVTPRKKAISNFFALQNNNRLWKDFLCYYEAAKQNQISVESLG